MARTTPLLVLLALLAGGLLIWLKLDGPVTTVRVKGPLTPAEQAQVRDALRGQLTGGLLSADVHALRGAIRALSWPRQVSVRRVWPDSLEVALDKALVVASWNDAYLTMSGEVVQLAAPEGNLIAFECRLSQPLEALDLYQRLQRQAEAAGLAIARLEENALGEWTLEFSNALELTLGRRALSERLERFLAVYEAELGDRLQEIARVDARYANGIAVSWRAVEGTPAPALARLEPIPTGPNGFHTRAQHGFR